MKDKYVAETEHGRYKKSLFKFMVKWQNNVKWSELNSLLISHIDDFEISYRYKKCDFALWDVVLPDKTVCWSKLQDSGISSGHLLVKS